MSLGAHNWRFQVKIQSTAANTFSCACTRVGPKVRVVQKPPFSDETGRNRGDFPSFKIEASLASPVWGFQAENFGVPTAKIHEKKLGLPGIRMFFGLFVDKKRARWSCSRFLAVSQVDAMLSLGLPHSATGRPDSDQRRKTIIRPDS